MHLRILKWHKLLHTRPDQAQSAPQLVSGRCRSLQLSLSLLGRGMLSFIPLHLTLRPNGISRRVLLLLFLRINTASVVIVVCNCRQVSILEQKR